MPFGDEIGFRIWSRKQRSKGSREERSTGPGITPIMLEAGYIGRGWLVQKTRLHLATQGRRRIGKRKSSILKKEATREKAHKIRGGVEKLTQA